MTYRGEVDIVGDRSELPPPLGHGGQHHDEEVVAALRLAVLSPCQAAPGAYIVLCSADIEDALRAARSADRELAASCVGSQPQQGGTS